MLKLLGSTSRSLDAVARSIFTLATSSRTAAGQKFTNEVVSGTFGTMQLYIWDGINSASSTQTVGANSTMPFCSSCIDHTDLVEDQVHPFYNILLQDAMNATGNPAKSLDSLFTALTLVMYTDSLAGFDFGDMAVMVFSSVVLLPGRWIGLIIVACLMATTYACLVVLAVIYLRGTRYTMLGNSWYAVAQLQSWEMKPVLQSASGLMDSEVETVLEERGLLDSEATLAGVVGDDNQVELMRRTRRRDS